ncbi:MAG: hypothetical protein CEN87_707 [Parcubacteria group bacterium Licking1014_1]|nr:MAG: hypothetical protein CEN87_707 [Parcubacteria group bacterium Licking1014_1]
MNEISRTEQSEEPQEKVKITPDQKDEEIFASDAERERIREHAESAKIDDNELAFSYMKGRPGALKSILESGFIGGPGVESWKTSFRERRQRGVAPETYFNITGRTNMDKHDTKRPEIYHNALGLFGIVMDVSDWKEAKDDIYEHLQTGDLGKGSIYKKIPPKTYFANVLHKDLEKWQRGDKIKVNPDKGFRTPYRISPKFFKGVVISFPYEFEKDEEDGKEEFFLKQEYNFRQVFKDVVTANLEAAKKTGMAVPIYDREGNLLWPQQMSYEDVKKNVPDKKSDDK